MLSIFISWSIYIISILTICCISFLEIVNLASLEKKNTFSSNWTVIKIISFFYIFFVFFLTSTSLYELGPVYVFYILLICIFSDVGGYVIGKTIGGKKLTKISPNKTISGSLGSFCFSIVPLLFFYNFDQFQYSYSFNNFLFCLELSLVCQFGDILISYIKRKAKAKDTGKFLPGHGGLLDRIDGLIFAIPYAWICINILS